MKKLLLFGVACLLLSFSTYSQSYDGGGAGTVLSDNNCPTTDDFTLDLTGEGLANLDGISLQLEEVCLDISHTWVEDMQITIAAPDGIEVELTSGNGGSGDDYTSTCFSMSGIDGAITGGSPPFTGTFIPEGDLNNINNGQDPNGVWTLKICDSAGGDIGTLNSWSIEFTVPPACPGPTGFSATNVTDTSADLDWTEGASCASEEYWIIEAGTGPPTVGTGTANACGVTVNAMGLNPSTDYELWVDTDCGTSTTDPELIGTFSTPATPAGCVNTSSFGSATLDGSNTVFEIATNQWTTEYTPINNVETGSTYEFNCTLTADGTHKYVTITDDLNNILDFGPSPFNWTSSITGNVRAHWTEDEFCNTATVSHTTTVQCTSCPPPCEISDVTAGTPSPCMPVTNTYFVDITVTYANAPMTGTLDINGTSFTITTSPQTETLELPADGNLTTIDASFSDNTGCSFSLPDAFTAPMDCAVTCTINSISIGTTGACTWDGTSSTFTQTVTIGYSVPPAGGTLDVTIGGITVNETITTSPQDVTVIGIPADGSTLDVTAVFSLDPSCTATEVGAVTAPDACPPPVNDMCSGALDIAVGSSTCGATTTGNNTNSTDSNSDPGTPAATCTNYLGGDIWFKVTVPSSGNVTISGSASDCCSFLWYETYEGSCGSLTSISCSSTNGNDPSAFEQTFTGRTPGEVLYIRAWDSSNNDGPGDFNFCAYEPCGITDITGFDNGDCDPATGLYSATVTITSVNPITTGDLDVNGQLFPVNGMTSQDVVLTGLVSDGLPVEVTAFFVDDAGCTLTEPSAFISPEACIEGCNISALTATPTACTYDGTSATYDLDVIVTYSGETGTLDLDVNGNMSSIAATGSPQTVPYTGLTADGMTGLNVTASFSGDPLCTESTTYDAPADCTPVGCTGGNPFGSASLDGTDAVISIASNQYTTEYSNINNAESGSSYEFSCTLNADGTHKYVTIQDETGTVLAFGDSPFTWVSTVTGTVRARWSDDAVCNTSTTNHTTTVQCTSCPPPCDISDVTAGTPSSCNPATNTYMVDITVTYVSAPMTGTLDINGTSFTITSSPQTETLELPADGNLITIDASFSDDLGCSFSLPDAFTAPMDCAVDCTINSITIGTTGDCTWDGTSATFTQTVTVDYSVPMGTLDVTVGGTAVSVASTGSPQEVMITGIPADGMTLDVTAAFSGDPLCTATEAGAVTAPDDGCTPPDCAGSPVLACGETINTGDLSGDGAWNSDLTEPGACFSTPGSEFVFQFVVDNDGDHTLDITLSSGTSSWNDYFYRTDEMCEETGWICLGDIATTATLTIPGLTAGTTVYVLVDSETIGAGRIHDVTLGCPPPPIANSGGIGFCQNADAVLVDGTNAKVNLLVGGDIIAAISTTEDLGMVEASYVRFDATDNSTRDYAAQGGGDGLDMIDRSIVITPTNVPTGDVTVFLYYTDAEYDELIANNDGDNASADWSELGITKFDTDVCANMVDPNNMGGTLVTFVGATAVTGGWEVEITVSSFSGFQVAEGNTALPIKLNSFTAKAEGRHNMIEWSTSTEINVQDHTLMKSDDAINWETLGIQDGEINSNSNIDYEMMDVSPFATTYYQLMTTDIDGTTSYSPIVSVIRDSERTSEFLGASPVPTRDVVNLNVYSSTDDNILITLTDISGKKILVDNRVVSRGDHQLPLDLSNMTNGVYMVTITSDFIQQTHRIIKN